ncbi:MAG: hypothetical protein MZW92_48860 [Comamonadaceae bacterium]|nr:hypothetical protein [Comamonadaceae bacterium]
MDLDAAAHGHGRAGTRGSGHGASSTRRCADGAAGAVPDAAPRLLRGHRRSTTPPPAEAQTRPMTVLYRPPRKAVLRADHASRARARRACGWRRPTCAACAC